VNEPNKATPTYSMPRPPADLTCIDSHHKSPHNEHHRVNRETLQDNSHAYQHVVEKQSVLPVANKNDKLRRKMIWTIVYKDKYGGPFTESLEQCSWTGARSKSLLGKNGEMSAKYRFINVLIYFLQGRPTGLTLMVKDG